MLNLRTKIRNENIQAFMDAGILGYKSEHQSTVLAGGAVRSFITKENPRDFDVFVIGEDATEQVKTELLAKCDAEYKNTFRCPQKLLYSYETPFGKMQVITPRTYATIEDLLDSFDLTPCRGAFDGERVTLDKAFIRDVKKKVCNIHRITYPTATMNRIFKYRTYGYSTFQATEEFVRQVNVSDFPAEDLFKHYID